MNRLLLFCCCVMLFTACKKVSDPAVINSNQKEIDDDIIAQYIRENNLTVVNAGDTTGVRAIIVKQVPGNTLYSVSSSVTVGYTGKQLTSGKIFAQTDSIHPSFKLGEALSGWKIGILKGQVNKGGIIRLIIPSRHGYGPYAQPGLGLPANAILDFTIEIFDVTN